MADERKAARIARNGFRVITDSLQREIEQGAIQVGSYLPTERELQSHFGASRAPIRKALAALVDIGWAKSVPNKGVMAARGFRPAATNQIAFIEGGSYVLKLMSVRLKEMLSTRGYGLVLLGGSSDYPLEYALQRAIDNDYAGAIIWPFRGFIDQEILQRAARQLPIIALDHRLDGLESDLVSFDYEAAAYQATEQLIHQGCRRIGVTGMLDMLEITHQRFRGYMRAMFANGLQPMSRDFLFTNTSGQDASDTSLLENRFRSGDRPDGLFSLQEIYLPHIVEAALRCGLSIPYDLKITTIGDDIDLSVDGIGMTTIALDWETFTNEAMQLMLDRLQGLHRPPQVRHASHQLVVRGLCGAPSGQWTNREEIMPGFIGQRPLPKSQFRYSSHWSVQRSDQSNS